LQIFLTIYFFQKRGKKNVKKITNSGFNWAGLTFVQGREILETIPAADA
jgi:hypothetical protein